MSSHVAGPRLYQFATHRSEFTTEEVRHISDCEDCGRIIDMVRELLKENQDLHSSDHVPADRLVGFLLKQVLLTEHEHEHLSRCPFCKHVMVDESADEFQRRRVAGG